MEYEERRNLAEIIETADLDMMSVFHEQLVEWLKYYMVVGGMPEAVGIFADTYPGVDFKRITQVQEDILQGYRGDFSKYADSMPRGLSLRRFGTPFRHSLRVRIRSSSMERCVPAAVARISNWRFNGCLIRRSH